MAKKTIWDYDECNGLGSYEDAKKVIEYSKSVEAVQRFVTDVMYKICKVDGAQAQEERMMKLFELLGTVKDIPSLAERVVQAKADAEKEDLKEDEEDLKEDTPKKNVLDTLESMFEDLDEETEDDEEDDEDIE